MMKHDIGCFGFGACGSNMVDELYNLGYDSLIANTAQPDLAANECPNQYHISGMYGCSKNRLKSLEMVGNRYKEIRDVIINYFYSKKVINLFTSMGGGTGGGGMPLVAAYLSAEYPDKIFNIIAVLPSFTEARKIRENAVDFYEDLKKLDRVSGIYILDNNQCDRFFINKRFAELYDRYINMSNPDKRGAIDSDERLTMTRANGCVYIAAISDTEAFSASKESPFYIEKDDITTNLGIRLNKQIDSNIFAPPSFGCKYLAISKTNDKVKEGCLREIIGEPKIDEFEGYNAFNEHLIIATGMPFPDQRIAELIDSINRDEEKQNRLEKQRTQIEIPKRIVRRDYANEKTIKNTHGQKVDIQALMNKFK